MDGIALHVKRHLKNGYVERILFENLKLSSTIPRQSYDLQKDESKIEKTKNEDKIYNDILISLKDADYIQIVGHIINIKSTIYPSAKTDDVIEGVKSLQNKINIDRLLHFLFILDVRNLNKLNNDLKSKSNVFVGAEPRITIFIRLAYWYFQCLTIKSFEEKAKDIHDKLRISNEILDQAKSFGLDSTKVKEILRQINTTISELMFISIIHTLDPKIISFKKAHEFLVKDKIAEVKTISPELENVESLANEDIKNLRQLKDILFTYIKKTNIRDNHLKKAIEKQNADIVFLNLTFSYQPKIIESIAKLEESGMDFSLKKIIKNLTKMKFSTRIPLIIIFTAMGFEYNLFAITLRLPIKKSNKLKKIDF